jgi:hypothetical protein
LIKEIGTRPHLGTLCERLSKADMVKLHRDNFTKFLDLVEEHDPDRKFTTALIRRPFGHEA